MKMTKLSLCASILSTIPRSAVCAPVKSQIGRLAYLTGLSAALACGCAAQVEVDEHELVATATHALIPVGGETTWQQGWASQDTGVPVAGNACFLTGIAGKFRGAGERV